MSDPIGSWISGGVAAVVGLAAGSWAIARRILSTVTRDELTEIMRELEDRHDKKMEEMRQTMLTLHEDNKEARATILALHEDNRESRHRLSNNIAGPVNKLNVEIVRLREAITSLRKYQ